MSETGEAKIRAFGHELPAATEHKWLFILALIGGLGTVYLIWKAKQTAAAVASAAASQPGASGATASGGGTSSTSTAPTPLPPLPTVELKFSEDTSNAAEFQRNSNVAQGGGGSLNVFGIFSLGGGGGGSNVRQEHVKTGVTNQVSVDTTITNATPGILQGLQSFFSNLIGSQQQRADTNLQELQSGNQYVGGTGVSPYVLTPAQIAAGQGIATPGGGNTGGVLTGGATRSLFGVAA